MRHIVTGIALTVLAAATPVLAADDADAAFAKRIAAGGMAEVEEGKLAQEKGSSQAVKDFGAMMVKDHSAANEKLKKIAPGANVKLPTEPDMKQKASNKMLSMKSGADFDKAYVDAQVKDHEDTVGLLQKEIDSGKNSELKSFASETLPTVQSHLKMARDLQSGGKGVAATTRH